MNCQQKTLIDASFQLKLSFVLQVASKVARNGPGNFAGDFLPKM